MLTTPPMLEVGSAVVQIVQAMGTEGVVATLLGTGFVGAITKALIDKYKPKVERDSAGVSDAEKASGMSLALVTKLQEELGRVGARVTTLEQKLETQTTRGDRLETRVREQDGVIYKLRVYVARATDFWQHVTEHWDTIRAQPHPPVFPRFEEE